MASSAFGVSKFKLVAEVAGAEHQLVQFQMSFGLNAVPRATALLAVGRDARNVTQAAPVHKLADKLIYLQPAKVYLEATGAFSAAGETWPLGRTLLFDGYLTGTSYRKSNNNVQLVFDFVHWLADLQFSSCISEISHPSNPFSYTYRASRKSPGTGTGLPTWLSQYAPKDYFTVGKVSTDLWGQSLQPFYCALAKEDLFRATGANRIESCVTLEKKENRQALAALERMPGGGCGTSSTSRHYQPLTLQTGALGEELGDAICRGIMDTIGSADFFQSFWDNLAVKLGPEFCFSMVPQIDKAFPAAVVPGLRQYYQREILATDQEYVDFQAALPRPLRAVAVYNTFYSETAANFAQADTAPNYDVGPGGCFAPGGEAESKGQVLVRRAPRWLTNAAAGMSVAGALNSVHAKGATTPGGGGPKGAKTPAQVVRDSGKLGSWFAQYLYMCESLRGRNGSIAGKFRLDIAPGTTVRIHNRPERFLGGEDQLGVDMVGLVHTVTCALDAEQGKAGTGMGLTHLRTIHENDDDKTSIPIHPLFAQAYTGAPLIDSMTFGSTPESNVLSGAPTQDVSGIA